MNEAAFKKLSWLVPVSTLVWLGCATPQSQPTTGNRLKIVVAPFAVEGQESAGDLGRAFAESLTIRLSQVDELQLLPVPAGPGDALSTNRAATSVIWGTLSRQGVAVQVIVRLQDPASGDILWTTRERDESGDLSGLATRVARSIVGHLELSYPMSYDFVQDLRGSETMESSRPGELGRELLQAGDLAGLLETTGQLVEQFPEDPVAHVRHAWALLLEWDAAPTGEGLVRLKDRLLVLDQVDPGSPYGDMMRGYVYRSSGEPDKAQILYSRVLARSDLSPAARAWALRQRSYAYLQVGNAAAAREDAQEAVGLDPAAASSWVALSKALEGLGRFDDAIEPSRQALILEPHRWRHHQRQGVIYTRDGRYAEAIEALTEACALSNSQEACGNLAVAQQRAGLTAQAAETARAAEDLVGTRWGFYNLACYRSLAGEEGAAMADLRRAIDLGFADALITTDIDLVPLRDIPEFTEVVTEVEARIQSRRQISTRVFPWQ